MRVSRRVRLAGVGGRERMGGERMGRPKGLLVGGSGEGGVLVGREVVVVVSSAQGSGVGREVVVVVVVSSAQGSGVGREVVSAAKWERRMTRRACRYMILWVHVVNEKKLVERVGCK